MQFLEWMFADILHFAGICFLFWLLCYGLTGIIGAFHHD